MAWPMKPELLSAIARVSSGQLPILRDLQGSCWLAEVKGRGRFLAELLRSRRFSRVALLADNGMDWVEADLACQLAGATLLPLPCFFSVAQMRHALQSSGTAALLSDSPAAAEALGLVRDTTFPSARSSLGLYLGEAGKPPRLPAGTGKITYTSGSTGNPRGVCLGNIQLLRQAAALALAVGLDSPRHLCLLPLSTLLENVAGVYAPLLAGGEVVLPSLAQLGMSGSVLAEPGRLLHTIEITAPHTLILTPQLLLLLVTSARRGWRPPASLRFAAVGGGKVAPELLLDARRHGLPAYEGYGLSECASVVSLNLPGADRPGSCGRPLDHLRVGLEQGEIVVEGNAMLGYLGEPDSWHPPAIRTGDLGALDADGYLHLDGRRKNLLISSYGRNISPEWVESEMLRGDLLREAVVLGDARPYCVALLSPRDEGVDDARIQAWIEEVNTGLPDYARVQRWRRLTRPLAGEADLLTANGRPRREAIQIRYAKDIETLYAGDTLGRLAEG